MVGGSAGRDRGAGGGAAALEGEQGQAGGTGAAGALPWGLRSPQGLTPTLPARTQAPQQREANGRVLGYRVTLSLRRRGRDPPTICNTTHTECSFSVPAGTRRVYLSAYNAAGESAPTEVVLLERKGEGSARNIVSPRALLPPSRLPWGAQPG